MFDSKAPCAPVVFFRAYSHQEAGGHRETWREVCDRTVVGTAKLGGLSREEAQLLWDQQYNFKCLTSGRALWVGGRHWLEQPENFPGAYNCTSLRLASQNIFGLLMELAMMGCGTGAVLTAECTEWLSPVRNKLKVSIVREVGSIPQEARKEATEVMRLEGDRFSISVGDSRRGWADAYQDTIDLAFEDFGSPREIELSVDLSSVRPAGEKLKGFGGIANPKELPKLFAKCVKILNGAIGRKLNSIECCLLIDEAAKVVVAGNIRRTAGIRQFDASDTLAIGAKDKLWQIDEAGVWSIDPERDALRMSNHTRIFDSQPTLEECVESVRKQYQSGEGAIQWSGEALARGNCDILPGQKRQEFLEACKAGNAREWIRDRYPEMTATELEHRLNRKGLNPCGEILGNDFMCNLTEVHLNNIDPLDLEEQGLAFKAGAIAAGVFLNHKFVEPILQESRELDPIVGVSFTGLFDFFVAAFGAKWLHWWESERPLAYVLPIVDKRVELICDLFGANMDDYRVGDSGWNFGRVYRDLEAAYLAFWRKVAEENVAAYCDKHGLKRPNRCTTVQPSGTKSLLTGASPGWHPPKAQRFIRRITVANNSAVGLAAIECGYSVVPSQSDKDDSGRLLEDPFDPRCTEWLIEIPTQAVWADLPGIGEVDTSKFSAGAQVDFYLQVQKFYTTHNTSATIELRENEIESLGKRIFEAIDKNEGYVSAALLARFDDKKLTRASPSSRYPRNSTNSFATKCCAGVGKPTFTKPCRSIFPWKIR